MLVGDSSKGCAGRRRADQVAQRAWCIELQRAARRDARLCRLVRGASLERLRSSFVAQYTELKALSRRQRRRTLRRWAPTIGAAALLMALATTPAQAATYNVIGFLDGSGAIIPDGPGTFSATTLRAAIAAANTSEGVPDTINLPEGVYTLSPGNGGSLNITDDLQIHGAGLALSAIDAGAIGQRVFDISATDVVGFSGFTLANGFVGDGIALGAGIRNFGADLTLTDVGVLDNTAYASANAAYGGGIYSTGGSLAIIDSLISNNLAQGDSSSISDGALATGGAIFFNASSVADSLTIVNSTITGNVALGGNGDSTSGTGGMALGGGIGIKFAGNSTSITASTITGNQALGGDASTPGDGSGGGLFVSSGSVTVTGSTFSDNPANASGGGISNLGSGTLSVTDSTFFSNTASGGGGIDNEGTATVTNSTLSGNSATDLGGGIENGGTLTVTNSTLSANSATNSGGGIYSTASTTSLNNSIVANSTSGGDCAYSGGTVNASNSLIGDGLGCVNGTNTNNLTGDPLLGPLVDNGGPTHTMMPTASSPALDNGDPTLAVDPSTGYALSFDQRGIGFPRTLSGKVDIGAYQHQPAAGDRIFANPFDLGP